MPLALSDEQLDMLDRMAEPLAPSHRSAFLEAVAARLSTLSRDAVGLGSVHRIAAEEQKNFLKQSQIAVGRGLTKWAR